MKFSLSFFPEDASRWRAFESVYKGYYARLYYYAFQFVADADTCKDLVNDVFEKLWEQWDAVDEHTAGAWLYTSMRNLCVDYLRHQQVEKQYAELYRSAAEGWEEDGGEYEELMCRIERVVGELSEPTRSIFKECYYHRRKYREVAEDFGMSSNGIKKHVMKALRLIRSELEKKNG